ncbi:MAG TPA: hypothetical protein VFG90_01930, partial [Nitrososphaeraceae archaeon]|nr:hypothetical protein [Nitrososphaeraceae archaeon]
MTIEENTNNIDYNKIADSLFYDKGLNIFPIDNGKVTYEPRTEYKEAPIPDEIHEEWKATGRYEKGIVLMPGPVFRGKNQGLWFVGIDLDREPGVKEFCNIFGVTSIDELKKRFMIEQHDKDPNSSHPDSFHVYFYSQIPFTDLKSDIMEICSNGKFLMCTTPSYHSETNSRWRIIGTDNPEILTDEQANKIMNDINEICKKNNVKYLDQSNYNYNGNGHGHSNDHESSSYNYISILSEELKEVCYSLKIPIPVPIKNSNSPYIIRNGTRHIFLLAIANTLLFHHKPDRNKNISYDRLKNFLFEKVNDILCEVKYPENELNRIWTDALNHYSKNPPEFKTNVEDNNNNNDSNKNTNNIKSTILRQLKPEIREQLLKYDCWGVISYSPLKLVIAHDEYKQIIYASIQKYRLTKKNDSNNNSKDLIEDDINETEIRSRLKLSNIVINAIPKEVAFNKNPLGLFDHKYTIKFVTENNEYITVGPKTLNEIVTYLKDRTLVYMSNKPTEVLSVIIGSFKQDDKLIETNELDTPGFYYIDGKIISYKTDHPKPTYDQIKDCCELLDTLQPKFKINNVFPTVLKWSIIAPFDFVLKQILKKWMPWLYPYGWSRTGKSSLGEKICCCIWDRYDDKDAILPFTAADTFARLGEALSRSTYPITINEVSNLNDENRNKGMVEMVKAAVEDTIARKKYVNGDYTEIPSFSACILTGNSSPPKDTGFRRRIIPIEFTQKDQYSEDEMKEFEKLFDERVKKELRYLGDFAAYYIMEHQQELLVEGKKGWKEIAEIILTEFYKSVGREAPEWIKWFVQETQLEDSKENIDLLFRSFLMIKINETYNKFHGNIQNLKANTDDVQFDFRLEFCLNKNLIPFL